MYIVSGECYGPAVLSDPASALRAQGIYVTAQRLAVLRAVDAQPHTAADAVIRSVCDEIGAVSRQSVYDTLNTLTDLGLLRRIQPMGSPARYEGRTGDEVSLDAGEQFAFQRGKVFLPACVARIFRQQQRPRVDALEPLAAGLQVSIYELLVRIGAVDPDDDRLPNSTSHGKNLTFTWPEVP